MFTQKIFATAGIAAVSAMMIGMTTAPYTQTAVAAPERCVSTQFVSGDILQSCWFLPNDKEGAKEAVEQEKELCKEQKEQGIAEKCSSSQTTFGEFRNSKK